MKRLTEFYINSFKGLSRDIWALAAIYLINRVGEMVIPFMSLYLTDQLGFTKTETGIVLTCFGLGALIGSNVGGFLTDRFGNFKVMFISLVGSGVAFNLILAFDSLIPLSLWMIVTAFFTSMFGPAAFSAVGKWGNPEYQTRGYSLLRMAINLGISIGPAIGGLLAKSVGYSYLFMLDGLTCFFAAGALFIFLGNKRKEPVAKVEKSERGRSPYKDSYLLTFLFLNLVNMVVFFQILFSVPVYFNEVLGLDEDLIGLFFTANGLMVLLLEMPIVHQIEQSKKFFKPLAAGALLIGLGYLCLQFSSTPLLAIVLYSILVAVGEVINFPLIPSLVMRRAGEHNQGRYMGMVSTMFAMAFLLAPISGLPVIERIGYDMYWYIAAGLSVSAFVALIVMEKKSKHAQ